jgi:hypothetical protein
MAAAASMMSPAAEAPTGHANAVDEMYDTVPNGQAPTLVGTPLAEGVDPDARTQVHGTPVEAGDAPSNVVSIGRARRGRHRFPSQPPSRQHRGLLGISAAAAMMVLAVTGGGAMFSQGALPGDSLYGIKQTTESAMVGLTPGQGNKAQRQLDYAATRIAEAQKVNAASTPDEEKAADISQALKGFDDQAQNGSQMWLASANSGSGSDNSAHLAKLADWAQEQNAKLSSMRSSMPAGAQPDADHSMRMLEDMRTRAQSLSNRQGCDQVTSGSSDDLGPLPAKGSCKASQVSVPAMKPNLPTATRTSAPTESSSSRSSSEHSSHSGGSSHDSDRDSSRSSDPTTQDNPLGGLSNSTGNILPGSDQQAPPTELAPPQNTSNKHDGGLLGGLLGGLGN